MWDRICNSTFRARRGTTGPHLHSHTAARSRRRPLVEVLENRELMTASLASIPDQSVPAQLGLQLALDGSASNAASQTFTATSDNPNIRVSVAQGPFWTVTVSHNSSGPADPQIDHQSMTFQLFPDLTPQTVARITNLTNTGYYTQGFPNANPPVPAGQYIPRITNATAGFSVVQGGSSSPTSTASSSGIPPINTEPVQQLAFTGANQLAMANTGQPTSTDAQFFITNGPQSDSTQKAFDFNYTLFGQLVSGQQTLTTLSQVTVTRNSSNELSQPVTPVVINAVALSDNNPNGVLHIDTTGSQQGQTANITITATDPATHTTATRTFKVTVSAYNGPTSATQPVINFQPITTPITTSATINTPLNVQLNGTNGYPGTGATNTISYQLVSQPTHGTISNFDATKGTFVYTPNPGFAGQDSLQYVAIATPSSSSLNLSTATSWATTVSITTGVNSGAVRVIPSNPNGTSIPNSNVLVVTPPPGNRKVTDNIHVTQVADPSVAGGQRIVVMINGLPDLLQPAASSLLHIVVFGTKASDNIQVDPNVTVPTTLDGGHGGNNVVKGGGGPTREHGWFGHTLLVGGVGSNQLIGRKGIVRFQPSSTTTTIFAGVPHERGRRARATRPGGTYYRFVHGRLVPVFSY
jgi:cyclophilin family peptidyl-prolyl cis-trans isomerase